MVAACPRRRHFDLSLSSLPAVEEHGMGSRNFNPKAQELWIPPEGREQFPLMTLLHHSPAAATDRPWSCCYDIALLLCSVVLFYLLDWLDCRVSSCWAFLRSRILISGNQEGVPSRLFVASTGKRCLVQFIQFVAAQLLVGESLILYF